jgi:hypothetical protein
MKPGAWRTELSVARASKSSSGFCSEGSMVKILMIVTRLLLLEIVVITPEACKVQPGHH